MATKPKIIYIELIFIGSPDPRKMAGIGISGPENEFKSMKMSGKSIGPK